MPEQLNKMDHGDEACGASTWHSGGCSTLVVRSYALRQPLAQPASQIKIKALALVLGLVRGTESRSMFIAAWQLRSVCAIRPVAPEPAGYATSHPRSAAAGRRLACLGVIGEPVLRTRHLHGALTQRDRTADAHPRVAHSMNLWHRAAPSLVVENARTRP
jgi:hypothetical protein